MLIIVYGRSGSPTPALCQFDLNRMNPDYAGTLSSGQREGKGGAASGDGGQQVALFCVGNAQRICQLSRAGQMRQQSPEVESN